MTDARYSLAPGLEIVALEGGSYLLRSDFTALQLSGDTAVDLVEKVLRDLKAPLGAGEIGLRLPGYSPDSLSSQLDALVEEGVLVVHGAAAPPVNPYSSLLDEVGLGAQDTLGRLAQTTVGILGLEAHGAHLAQILADAGVGRLLLADPFPFEPAHRLLTPVHDPAAVGISRELALSRHISREGLTVETGGPGELDREKVAAFTERCQLIVVCWDRGFYAAHHWANAAALEHGVPALFSELKATSSFAGPFFLPTRSACWMCYRMRSLAAEKDFDLAMSYEEHLDGKRVPTLAERPILPVLAVQLASTLALEVIKVLTHLNQPTLVDKVLEFDGLQSQSQLHPVLVKPNCPVCSKKKPRSQPSREQLLAESAPPARTPLHELAPELVSRRTGIVVEFAAASRDATEPTLPLVWRARLSNHYFHSDPDDAHMYCSGKGMTLQQAWSSCLGEAVERYSGGCWDPEETVFCRRAELEGPKLDPAELVLYRPEHYPGLPYSPYAERNRYRWVRARSLIREEEVWVPAIAVFMEYEVAGEQEFLFPVTSNGLAAGPSLAEAVLNALYEVVERDAMMIAWANRLPGRRFSAAAHPDPEVRGLAAAYERRGVELALYELPTDHPVSVMVAVAYQRDGYGGPFATVGMGASLDPAAAARSAAIEVGQVRPAFRQRARTSDAGRVAELAADPSKVKSLEDHALLYADPSMSHAFDFLNGKPAEWPETVARSPQEELAEILGYFDSAGQEALYVNLTPPDLEPLGLFTARVILPGYQPIWFGYGEPRLGGSRLFDLPVRLGLRDRPAGVESLNPLPHPIA